MIPLLLPLLLATHVHTIPLVSTSPEECPLSDGNILRVILFLADSQSCMEACQADQKCIFYKFYPPLDGRPDQCFFFDTCGKMVYEASPSCAVSSENCVAIQPFVATSAECGRLCQASRECEYYRLVTSQTAQGASNTSLGLEGQATYPDLCYMLSSCSQRIVEEQSCTLGRHNFLDVKFFTPDLPSCRQYCQQTEGCRYYYWYPIDYSPAPLYCYLFKQCAAGDDEPLVALVVGGRHPGHYFLDSGDFTDVVTSTSVCPLSISPPEILVKRAGATASYIDGGVLLCGGRSRLQVHGDCVRYDLQSEVWANHSILVQTRDESAMAILGSQLYIMGGNGQKTTEVLETSLEDTWFEGPELPTVLSRSCAVSTGSSILMIGGHNNDSTQSLSIMIQMEKGGSWTFGESMLTPRRDHACLYVEFENSQGVLVTGGQGPDDSVLGSAEFYDLATQQWTEVSPLIVARTEHVMSLVYGVPTIIGGVNGDQFISSMEQFDKSERSGELALKRDWRIINQVLTSPRYEHTVASIPASKMRSCPATSL